VTGTARGVTVIELSCMGKFFSTDKAAEMNGANQFFDFILERFAFVGGVAIISVVAAVLGHVSIGGLEVLRGGGMRSAWSASSRRRDLGTLSGAYLVNRGCLGSLGLVLGRGSGLSGAVVEGV